MARSIVAYKRISPGTTKVRTGCATCRIRKVKCDEAKPACQKCIATGRTCDGYEDPFRNLTPQPVKSAPAKSLAAHNSPTPPSASPTANEITAPDVDLLSRCFSIKTLFDVHLGCEQEAQAVLLASASDPSVKHAVLSLRALREGLEAAGDGTVSVAQRTPNYKYGLEQYSLALGDLVSNLACPTPHGLRSALLCCQVFIAIEQVQGNYAAMAQHMVRGLRILHEHHARPTLNAENQFVPAQYDHLPLLDVFIIKIFAAPCKFADAPTSPPNAAAASSTCPLALDQHFSPHDLRVLAPDMRAALTRIALSTLAFLDKISRARSAASAQHLVAEKTSLLASLETWRQEFSHHRAAQLSTKAAIHPPEPEPLSAAFTRLFHVLLTIIVTAALEAAPRGADALRAEYDCLQHIADEIGARIRTYRMREYAAMGKKPAG